MNGPVSAIIPLAFSKGDLASCLRIILRFVFGSFQGGGSHERMCTPHAVCQVFLDPDLGTDPNIHLLPFFLFADGSTEAITKVDALGDTVSVSGRSTTATVAGVGNFTGLLLRAVPGQYNVTINTPYTIAKLAPLAVAVQVSCVC